MYFSWDSEVETRNWWAFCQPMISEVCIPSPRLGPIGLMDPELVYRAVINQKKLRTPEPKKNTFKKCFSQVLSPCVFTKGAFCFLNSAFRSVNIIPDLTYIYWNGCHNMDSMDIQKYTANYFQAQKKKMNVGKKWICYISTKLIKWRLILEKIVPICSSSYPLKNQPPSISGRRFIALSRQVAVLPQALQVRVVEHEGMPAGLDC